MSRGTAVLLAVVVVVGCGGDDATVPAETTAPDGIVDAPADDATVDVATEEPPPEPDDVATNDEATEQPPPVPADEPTPEPAPEPADVGLDGLACDDIFGVGEVSDFIGEPIELVATAEPSLGQITCSWETVEDPDDADDLAFSFVLAQVYTGDPIPAANFIDPTFFDEVTMIDGLGDVAFWEDSLGPTFYVLDGDVAGVFSYADADLGDPERPTRRSFDDVLELFREFHRRIT